MDKFFFYNFYLDLIYRVPLLAQSELLLAVVTYGTEGKYELKDTTAKGLFPYFKYSIDASKRRYKQFVKNGKKGGRTPFIKDGQNDKELIDEFHYMQILNYSSKGIADHFGISTSTVYRLAKKYPLPQEIIREIESGKLYRIGLHTMKGYNEYDVGGRTIKLDGKPTPVDELREQAQIRNRQEIDESMRRDKYMVRGQRAYEIQKKRKRWINGRGQKK